MAKVKVFLEDGEDDFEAHVALCKALEHHSSGGTHDEEAFEDPAMLHAAQAFEEIHKIQYAKMLQEILAALDGDYSDGNY